MASSDLLEPFMELSNELNHLFERYEGLKQSLASLSNNVFNIKNDPRDQATKINIFGRETRYNLAFYLNTLKDMSTAMAQTDFEECKEQADTARYTMKTLNDQVQAEGMFKALEAVVNQLRQIEDEKKESDPDVDKDVEKALEGANKFIQDIAWGLLKYIKEQLRQALDDSELFINSDALEQEVEKVRKTIPAVKTACDENISALDNIISTMDRLSQEEENEESCIKSLKKNAEALRKTCDDKLPTVEAESRLQRFIAQSAQVTLPPKTKRQKRL